MKKNLTDAFCRKVKPPPKKPTPPKGTNSKKIRQTPPLKFWDNRGMDMFFQVSPNGKKTFRIKYSLDGKRNSMLLGVYPVCSLKEAREKAIDARKLIDNGINPHKEREKIKQQRMDDKHDTFRKFAEEWFKSKKADWCEEREKTVRNGLERELYPFIGDMPIKEITSRNVLDALDPIIRRGHHSVARRVRQFASNVFLFAMGEEKTDRNPVMGLKGRLPTPPPTKHFAAIITSKKLGRLLLAIDAYEGGGRSVLKYALRLMPLVFVRTNELRFAEWKDIDLEESLWSIPAEKMKTRKPHIVPLSPQAVKILKDVQRYTGKGKYVFPHRDTAEKPMGRSSMYRAIVKMVEKEDMSVHGFRSSGRTMIREQLKLPTDWIETQLAHASKDIMGDTYDRAIYLEDRKVMMNKWANKLDEWKAEAAAEANTG